MRTSLILATTLTVFAMQSPANAQSSVADGVVARVQSEGYTVSEVRRSWLGRIVITATDGEILREVVVNRTSGEILRDQNFPVRSEDRESEGVLQNEPSMPPKADGQGGGHSGSNVGGHGGSQGGPNGGGQGKGK